MKKQMYKLHAPHRQSGYIADVELRETRGADGTPDWEMFYTPGRKARAEFRSFRRSSRALEIDKAQAEVIGRPTLRTTDLSQPQLKLLPDHEVLVAQLVKYKVAEKKARELVAAKPDAVRLRLRAIPYLPAGQGNKNFAGRLVTAIEQDYELPRAPLEVVEQERRAVAARERESKTTSCPYCKELGGWRYVEGHSGPVRRCTHDAAQEKKFSA